MSGRSENTGKVIKVYGNGYVDILVHQPSECSSCNAHCSIAGDQSEKVFHLKSAIELKAGDHVKVIIDNVEIKRSAFVVYIVPIVLVVCAALIMEKLHIKDIKIGLTSIFIIALYFLGLNLFMRKKESKIKIEKIT